MTTNIVQEWLKAASRTAAARDFEAHMNLISRKVSLTGIPGFAEIGYEDWAAQCKHEFENQLIQGIRYSGLNLVAETPERIMFRTFETVEGSGGEINENGLEMLLEKEADGVWRLIQERVLPPEESAHYGLSSDSGVLS